MVRLVAICAVIFLWLGSAAQAQTATWRGRVYTPTSFPRAMSCQCGMCQSLRAQWAAQSSERRVAGGEEAGYEMRQVTRYRSVKRCVGGVCQIVREPYTVWERVRISTKSVVQTKKFLSPQPVLEKPTPGGDFYGEHGCCRTPKAVAEEVLAFLEPNPSDVVVDLGCGDGELLKAAEPYGCRLVGIELDKSLVESAMRRVPNADIVWGDIRHQRYEYGTIYLAYLFPDLILEVLPKLPRGALLVSLEHEIPQSIEADIEVEGETHKIYLRVM